MEHDLSEAALARRTASKRKAMRDASKPAFKVLWQGAAVRAAGRLNRKGEDCSPPSTISRFDMILVSSTIANVARGVFGTIDATGPAERTWSARGKRGNALAATNGSAEAADLSSGDDDQIVCPGSCSLPAREYPKGDWTDRCSPIKTQDPWLNDHDFIYPCSIHSGDFNRSWNGKFDIWRCHSMKATVGSSVGDKLRCIQ
jgi:hypothetical protein